MLLLTPKSSCFYFSHSLSFGKGMGENCYLLKLINVSLMQEEDVSPIRKLFYIISRIVLNCYAHKIVSFTRSCLVQLNLLLSPSSCIKNVNTVFRMSLWLIVDCIFEDWMSHSHQFIYQMIKEWPWAFLRSHLFESRNSHYQNIST